MKLDKMVTKFENKVYEICNKVPKGKVTTYKAIADKMKSKAYRAVGQALNKNPFAPKVPCHRVVNSKGHLHGFARGLIAKSILLRKEGIIIKNNLIFDPKRIIRKIK